MLCISGMRDTSIHMILHQSIVIHKIIHLVYSFKLPIIFHHTTSNYKTLVGLGWENVFSSYTSIKDPLVLEITLRIVKFINNVANKSFGYLYTGSFCLIASRDEL